MRQAEQTSWIVSFEVWQQKRVRDLVRCIGYVFGWLNLLGLTNAIYYVASEFSDPLFAKITGKHSYQESLLACSLSVRHCHSMLQRLRLLQSLLGPMPAHGLCYKHLQAHDKLCSGTSAITAITPAVLL